MRAKQCAVRALTIYKEVYGDAHVLVAGTLNTLGGIYAAQQRFKRARECYLASLTTMEAAMGPMHKQTASCKRNYAVILKVSTPPVPKYKQINVVQKIIRMVTSLMHKQTASSKRNYAAVLKESRKAVTPIAHY